MKNLDILTLLKSNIKHKKGTFISIIILMTIVTTVVCAIISVRDNYRNSFENAYNESDCGDAIVMIDSKVLSNDLKKSVENSKLVEKADYYDSLVGEGIFFDDSGISDNNTMFLTKVRKNIRLYNNDESGFEDGVPPLKKGEIYLPLGCKSNLSCSVGDKVEVTLRNNSTMEFKVKGFVQEPSMGSSQIGVKQLFISSDDYNTVSEEYKKIKKDKFITNTVILNIHQAKDSNLSPTKFQRELNIETKIADMGYITINKDSITRWSTLMPDIIINIVIVFCMFLFVIVLIVISHSIGTEIELEYKTIGILKSQGFTSGKIRFIMFLQYMIAQIMGIILGIFFAFPVEKAIGKACQDITAVLADTGISVVYSLLFALTFIICSSVIIFIKTHKLRKISPVKAINGGHEQIYFESRLNIPISKKFLSPTLALRQFTSGKKRYAGIILMGMILTFFMITVNLLGGILNSKTALNAMGIDTPDMSVSFKEEYIEKNKNMPYEDIENLVEKYTDIEEKQIENNTYCSLNGEYIICQIYKFPQYIGGIIKGREPKYKNELIITDMVADALDLKLGDKVTVSKKDVEKEFIVSGIFQSTYDSGMTFAINYEGARNLKMDVKINYERFTLKDKTKTQDIKNEINQKYGENAHVYICKPGETGLEEEYKDIIDLLKIIIYSFSIIFAFVVVRMVCVKTFIQERKDIGIFKALGFTSNKLRLGFAIRFFISALIGSAIGIILSILLSAKSISAALSMLGIVKAEINYTLLSIVVPVLIICIGFFVFSFIASRKIKKVEIKELIME